MASGKGRPPLIRTPSISNAKAKLSAVGISAGVPGDRGVMGESSTGDGRSSSRFIVESSIRAFAMEAAKVPPW